MGRSGKLNATNDYLIPSFLENPNYAVNSDGSIWTKITKTGKVSVNNVWRLAGHVKNGYLDISFEGKKLRAHRIVYAKFKGELSPDLVVNHEDGNRLNNHPDNLKLDTQSYNNYHRYRELRKAPVMGNKVLTWEIVREIRRLKLQTDMTQAALANMFSISKGHVSEIINNQIWIEGKEYNTETPPIQNETPVEESCTLPEQFIE